jgi:phosphoglycolate phosphatase
VIIVFDLDGTLIDSARDISESVSEMVESYGAPPLPMSAVVEMVGDGAPILVKRALRESGLNPSPDEALARYLRIYDKRLMNHTSPYDGIVESLSVVLRHGSLAVLTNKPLGPSIGILEALGLRGFFTRIIGGDGEHGRKPDPAGLRSLQALAPGHQLVMIGDSPADWNVAQAADARFVFARYGFGAGKFGATPPDAAAAIDHAREIDRALAIISR